jgi:methenyltetrahydrofolate cyclohydrolase
MKLIGESMLTEKSVVEFLDELASASPAPGGGSTAALAGALGAALTSMVCNVTIGKKKYFRVQGTMEAVFKESDRLRKELAKLVDEDTQAFNGVMAAMSLPKETEEERKERSEAIQRAMVNATTIPLRIMALCGEALAAAKISAEHGNVNSISDAGVGALMLHAACLGAQLNVQINLKSINDTAFVEETAQRAGAIARHAESLNNEIMSYVKSSISPELS